MKIKQSMIKYKNMHVKVFKKSFKLNKPLSQALLELAKYISIVLLFILFLYVSIRFFISVMPVLASLDSIGSSDNFIANESIITTIMQQSTLLDLFLIKLTVLLIITALLLSFILALFNSFIVAYTHNNKWSSKKFIKILLVYSVLTLIYFTIMFISVYYMLNILMLTLLLVLVTMIYSYVLVIFQLSIEDIPLIKYLKKGIFNCFKLHKTIPVLFVGLVIFIIIIFIIIIMAALVKQYVLLLLLPLIILWNIWMLNYQYHILHHVK